MLLDQNNREHAIDAFPARPELRLLPAPQSETNVASGCPLFFPLNKLQSPKHAYVKDDTMFLKCARGDKHLGWRAEPSAPESSGETSSEKGSARCSRSRPPVPRTPGHDDGLGLASPEPAGQIGQDVPST